MAKKKHICGNAHSFLDEIFGCSNCKKEEKRRQAQATNRANDNNPTFVGWRTDPSWSNRKKKQFRRGLPPDHPDD